MIPFLLEQSIGILNISLELHPNKYLPKTTWVQIGTSSHGKNNEDYGFL